MLPTDGFDDNRNEGWSQREERKGGRGVSEARGGGAKARGQGEEGSRGKGERGCTDLLLGRCMPGRSEGREWENRDAQTVRRVAKQEGDAGENGTDLVPHHGEERPNSSTMADETDICEVEGKEEGGGQRGRSARRVL